MVNGKDLYSELEDEIVKPNEVLILMAKAFLLAIDEDKSVDVDLLQDICESIVEKEEIEIVELLKEAIGDSES